MVDQKLVTQNVENWIQQEFNKPLDLFGIYPIPNLNTSLYNFFMIEQKGLREAGHLYVMSDGNETLQADLTNFSHILSREHYLDDPSAIPPEKLAELYIHMVEGRSGGILTDSDDIFPDTVDTSQFSPPHIQSTNNGVVLLFWATGHSPQQLSRWEVKINSDYQIESQETPLT